MLIKTRTNGQFIRQIVLTNQLLVLFTSSQVYDKTGLKSPRTTDEIIGRPRLIAAKPDIEQSISIPKCFSWPLAGIKSVQNGKLTKSGGNHK